MVCAARADLEVVFCMSFEPAEKQFTHLNLYVEAYSVATGKLRGDDELATANGKISHDISR